MAVDLAHLAHRLAEQATREPGTGRLRLPTERELVASLELTRGVLREQLTVLEMLGFLERTQGRGSYLRVPDGGFIQLYFDLSTQLGHLSTGQFRSARELIELSVAESAARTATPEQVAGLRALVDTMVEASAAGDEAQALEADLEFHRTLYRVVDNPIFTIVLDGLRHAMRSEVVERRRAATEHLPVEPGQTRVVDTVHHEVVDAVEARDPDAARAAMRRHFEVWSSTVQPPAAG
ncbi:FadR/GntR family transcriptional regulator [Actinokineospora bangkokensis]|uniref:HTH gntR-type domain-containing protein n=1 Tax=Actinokineospora bangkokensis TaxID=1193682 RepID=A0A1Q9LPR3_9PSEU|nr:FCD domain-containing protein [Actinokineospora bangkokensis]OLR93991.1 hypothetical protein BJP25_13500 [Actinokineospora bangkokensis]